MAERMKTGAEAVNPYDDRRAKGTQVEEMFDAIAPAYDFMNTAMSFGLHRYWRDKALRAAARAIGGSPAAILDVATGTGDVAFRLHKMFPEATVRGIDLSEGMLAVARRKLAGMDVDAATKISFEKADCMSLPFGDATFDLITVAYGVRNFEYLLQGLREMRRTLRPGGVLCIIELSTPQGMLTGPLYRFYSRTLIPTAGRLASGDSRAYTYLPESIAAAPQGRAMTALLKEAGFTEATSTPLTFGAVTYYLSR